VYKAFPFKFNVHWLNQPEYVKLVHTVWNNLSFQEEGNKQVGFLKKLKVLKLQTKRWIKVFKKSELLLLEKLETDIEQLLIINVETPLTMEEERRLGALETNRNSILRRTEDI